jgi:hypothetical protein
MADVVDDKLCGGVMAASNVFNFIPRCRIITIGKPCGASDGVPLSIIAFAK